MGLIIDIYRNDLWLATFHLLMFAALIYALVRIGRHLGPSICVILALLLDYAAFLLGPLSVYASYDFEWLLMHSGPGRLRMVSILLLLAAAFGWRSRRPRATVSDLGVTPASPAPTRLPATAGAVRIPLAWTVIVTVIIVLTSLLSLAFFLAIAGDADRDIREALAITFLIASPVTQIVNAVLTMMILYRAWKAVQDDRVRTTPGKAVGFLFIPLFNFYWLFVAIGGYAGAFNTFAARHRIPVPRLSPGLFYTNCILSLLGIAVTLIPMIGLLYSAFAGIIPLLVLWSITNRVNELHACVNNAQTISPDLSHEP